MKRIPFWLLNLSGAVALLIPFLFASADHAGSARAADAPWLMAFVTPLLLVVALVEVSRGRMDSRTIAMLGVLAACAAAMRLPISFAGANLFFFLPMIGGIVYGATFGFLLGAIGMGASALLTGGIGPWLPFQMWAAGWVGLGAGLLRPLTHTWRPSRTALVLGVYGFAAAFFYGLTINLYFWPVLTEGSSAISWHPGLGLVETARRYGSYYLLTSSVWDSIGAVTNLLLVLAAGPPTIRLMRRFATKLRFETAGGG